MIFVCVLVIAKKTIALMMAMTALGVVAGSSPLAAMATILEEENLQDFTEDIDERIGDEVERQGECNPIRNPLCRVPADEIAVVCQFLPGVTILQLGIQECPDAPFP